MGNKRTPEIRFAGFTDAWEQRELGEVLDNQYNGQTPSRANANFWSGDINWLSSGELNRAVVSKTIEKITESGRENANLKIVPKGTFVMAITGLEATGTRGNCAKLGIDTALNQSCMALYPNKKLLNSSFLFQWYRKVGEEYGLKYTQGTKQQSYNAELIKILPIILPSVSEQINIADFFDSLDHLITLHQCKWELLKETKECLLQKMFPKDGANFPEIRFAGFTDAWEQRKFEKVFDVHTDFVSNGSFQALKDNVKLYHTENYAYMIRLQDASNNWKGPWLYTDKKGFEFLDKSTVYENDILMSDRGTIGKFFLVPKLGKPMTLSSNAVLLRSSKNDNYFIYYLLNTKEVGNQIKMRTTPGAQPMISKTEFKQITAKFPRLNEQIKIGSFFKQLDDTITLHQRELDALKDTKKAFFKKMFV